MKKEGWLITLLIIAVALVIIVKNGTVKSISDNPSLAIQEAGKAYVGVWLVSFDEGLQVEQYTFK